MEYNKIQFSNNSVFINALEYAKNWNTGTQRWFKDGSYPQKVHLLVGEIDMSIVNLLRG